jgi:hypothetical protein
MVCRASAGACAPTVGARLQVRSGLTGESIARRQLLRCDNAETDPRVNLETCRALGIASIVVLPLLRRTGEVRALFELFSDHPYAFEERDLVALERMAALTITALDLAEQRHDSVTFAPPRPSRPPEPRTVPAASAAPQAKEIPKPQSSSPQPSARADERHTSASPESGAPNNSTPPISAPVISTLFSSTPVAATPAVVAAAISAPVTATPVISPPPPTVAQPTVPPPIVYEPIVSEPTSESDPPQPVPEAMRRVQKCAACGFPVSEGRTFCLDCENLERLKIESDKKARQKSSTEFRPIEVRPTDTADPNAPPTTAKLTSQQTLEPTSEAAQPGNPTEANPPETNANDSPSAESLTTQSLEEILPPFLTNPQLVEESWLAKHVNLLAFVVLIAAVLVAAVVFFR